MAGSKKTPPSGNVVIVGGGIAGLYCARKLAAEGFSVTVLEGTGRFGGRIETGKLLEGPYSGGGPHLAEFGPMRFELDIQPLFDELRKSFCIDVADFEPPASPEPPVEYPLAADERDGEGCPLSSLELLKLGTYRLFGQVPFIEPGRSHQDGRPRVKLDVEGQRWLDSLGDAQGRFDDLRKTAVMPGTSQPLYRHGFWNVLYTQLSPMAVAKILHFGTFYHLMPDNPNAVEWSIFWLRLFKLDTNKLSTLVPGVQALSDALFGELVANPEVDLRAERMVTSVRPLDSRALVETNTGETFEGDHVILALPKTPLLALANQFPEHIRADLDSVIAFPLLKVFCVTETPNWWKTNPPKAQEGAWNVPTRELHYLPAFDGSSQFVSPEHTLVLFYTDRPANSYWQLYLHKPEQHHAAEINESPELRDALASALFNLHWEWAKNMAGFGDATGRDALSTPKGRHIAWGLGEYFADLLADLGPEDPLYTTLAREHPGLVGDPARILFRPEEVDQWQRDAISDYAIRDWSRMPYGAGCHAWAPGAQSCDVRRDLAAFSFEGSTVRNLHVCGEAYSDYQGFIEGALRSAEDALAAIPSP